MRKNITYNALVFIVLYSVCTILFSCRTKDEIQQTTGGMYAPAIQNSFANIDRFVLPLSTGNYTATISATTVLISVPNNADVSSVAPKMVISDDAQINPSTKTTQNFENNITYVVTAQNGNTNRYTTALYRLPPPRTKNSTGLGSEMTVVYGANTAPFSNNVYCANNTISVNGCNGATTVTGDSGTSYPLVEINGQCWLAQNLREESGTSPSFVANTDNAYYKYYDSSPSSTEGLLYQWSAAMSLATEERSRGLCPVGFHVPSDCEWMYLEHGLGLAVDQQKTQNSRGMDIALGTKLLSGGVSGFDAEIEGIFDSQGASSYRTVYSCFWTSTKGSSTTAVLRQLRSSSVTVSRSSMSRASGLSVRCLKD